RLIVSPADGAHGAGESLAAGADDGKGGAPTAPYPIAIGTYPSLRAAASVFREIEGPLGGAEPFVLGANALPFRSSPLGLAYDDVFNTIIESRTVVVSGIARLGVDADSAALRPIVRHPVFARTYTDAERGRWLSRSA